MSIVNKLAENCVLEIGEIVGTKDFTTTTQTGTTTTNTFLGCKNNPGFFDQGFNESYTQRVPYEGVMSPINLMYGANLQTSVGIGCIAQGCQLTYLTTWNSNQFQPGSSINDNKIFYMTLYKDLSFNPVGLVFIPPYQMTTTHFTPYNAQSQSDNVQGRSIYFINHIKTQGTNGTVIKRELTVFDVIGTAGGDDILLKGNGSDFMDDYSMICPDLWTHPEDYTWYISAYMHSGNWDSSKGTGNPFYWMGGSLDVTTQIGSYEGSRYRSPGVTQVNECYNSKGLLGLRSDYFGDSIGDVDCFEIEIKISEIFNATLSVLEGTANNTTLTPLGNNLTFDSTGIHKVCLSALKRSQVWNDTAYSGGLLGMDANRHFDWADGSVNLLNAEAIDSNIPARITLDYIKVTKKDPDIVTTVTPVMSTVVDYTIDQIEYTHLDIFDSSAMPLALTYSIGSIKDLTKRAAGYSKTFMIPANQHNNTILNPMLAVGALREKIDWQPCRIKVDGIIVFKGLLRVEEGVTGMGGAYSCHIIQDSIDWTTLLKDLKICDIALLEPTEAKQVKSYANIIDSWNNNPVSGGAFPANGDDYHFGLVNYGDWDAQSINPNPASIDYNHNPNDFHPSIFAYRLIHKIFAGIGYKLESNFIESETFTRLCHPYTSGEEYIEVDLFGPGGSQFTKVERTVKTTAGGNFSSGGMCPHGDTRYWYPNLTLGTDSGNNWDGNSASNGFVAPFTGDYSLQAIGKLYLSQNLVATNTSYIGIYFEKNGSFLQWAGVAYKGDPGISNGITKNQTIVVTLNAGDKITYRIKASNNSFVWDMWLDASHMSFSAYPVVSSIVPSYNYNLSKILPCTKQMDYLKGLSELFNLQWTADKETKVVRVEPYDQFYGSGKTVDWTDKLDISSWTDSYVIKELAQSVNFKYKKDTSDKGIESLYRWREINELEEYKSYTELNEDRFRKEVLNLGSTIFHSTYRFNNYGTQPNPNQHGNSHPYAPLAYAWGDLSWTDPFVNKDNPLMPVIWMNEGGHINGTANNRPENNKTPKAGLRILNYYGKKDCSDYNFIDDSNTTNVVGNYPYMDWINGWDKGNKIDPFNLSWDDYDDGNGFVSPGLFSKYWRNAYEKMNGSSMLRTCRMALTAVDMNLFDYTDLVHLKIDGVSTYWSVQSIKDFKPNTKELTEVELIEWKYDTNYINKSSVSKRKTKPEEGQETFIENSRSPIFKTEYPNNTPNNTASNIKGLNTNNSGELEMYGGEIVVENEDGTICNLVYTEKEDIKKLYLKREEEEIIDEYTYDNKVPYTEQDDNNC